MEALTQRENQIYPLRRVPQLSNDQCNRVEDERAIGILLRGQRRTMLHDPVRGVVAATDGGVVDIYMPDFKFWSKGTATRLGIR